jgi:hypothetical protein
MEKSADVPNRLFFIIYAVSFDPPALRPADPGHYYWVLNI